MAEKINERTDIFRGLSTSILENAEQDNRKRVYITPQKILWETNNEYANVINSGALLKKRSPQISLAAIKPCVLCNNGRPASVLLDFGCELHGGIVISAWKDTTGQGAKIRVRFGESAKEAMSNIGDKTNATNDHANRDIEARIGSMSMNPLGETGFRFVRIDLLDLHCQLELKTIQAVFIYKDLKYHGSFQCSDVLLNKIWDTGAYTVHLNTQNYIWDGIKRDRLVWVGDMHPEVATIKTVFGYDDAIPKSLDFIKEETSLPGWMNDFPAYSMWWVIIHHDWFFYTGDYAYLEEQKEYMIGLHKQLSKSINEYGKDITPETRFVDWPSQADQTVVDAGLQALHTLAVQKLQKIFEIFKETKLAEECKADLCRLKQFEVDYKTAKQAAALLVLAGLKDAKQVNDTLLSIDGSQGMSTFMGYYILSARAMADDYQGCLDSIREYWGGMLQLGATTFWEDFDIRWLEDAEPIDSLCDIEGQVDVHGSYGNYCYSGYRHSLCHGWAAGATPWLSEHVLGVKILEPGCKRIEIIPHLGDLSFAKGSYPTPYGDIHISHRKMEDGMVESTIQAPDEVEIIRI